MTPLGYGKRMDWLKRDRQEDKTIVLFDMDGTLSESRKPFDKKLLEPLRALSQYSEIGIVSGSDYDYISQQMEYLLNKTELRYKIHILPCNGTKYYKPPENNGKPFELIYDNDMKVELGNLMFKELMVAIIQAQASLNHQAFPLTGHFIQYRGSMINWCPIGRNASDEERSYFIKYDKGSNPTYRQTIIEQLKNNLSQRGINVTAKFGGDTSFDIYPNGWDKRYCLKHFPDYNHWFVGDRCGDGGNDKEIYDSLFYDCRAFKTEDPDMTKLIIEERIIPRLLD